MLVRRVKNEDTAAIARVNVDTWKSAFCGIISDSYLKALSYSERERNFAEFISHQDELTFAFIAENDEGEIIGFTLGGREREGIADYKGEIYALYVLEEWQKCGVGTMLVKAAATQLFQSGISSLLLWTLQEGSACNFYEKLGAKLLKIKESIIGEEKVMLAAYAWDNIKVL